MAKCPVCKKNVGSLANKCWYCGAPLHIGDHKETKHQRPSFNLDALLIVAIVIVTMLAAWDIITVELAGGSGDGPANIIAYESWVYFLNDREETSEKINYTRVAAGDIVKIFDTVDYIDYNPSDNATEILFVSVVDEDWQGGVREAKFSGNISSSFHPGDYVVIKLTAYQVNSNVEGFEESNSDWHRIEGPYEPDVIKHAD
jgi:hypothetical protein